MVRDLCGEILMQGFIPKMFPPDKKPDDDLDVLVLYRANDWSGSHWIVAGLFEGEWLAFENPDQKLKGVIGWTYLPKTDIWNDQ
jgi:hypothetical protein